MIGHIFQYSFSKWITMMSSTVKNKTNYNVLTTKSHTLSQEPSITKTTSAI